MDKTVLILKGSPRKNGNSSVLADQVAQGARQKGAEVASFRIDEMEIFMSDTPYPDWNRYVPATLALI